MKEIGRFNGFSRDGFSFLSELKDNNNTEWFAANRSRYDDNIVAPSRSFVVEMGEFFDRLNPAIRTAPKFNETLMRINKDMRFSRGVPYRTYFLIHFGRFKMDCEFYAALEPERLSYGLFINNSGENKDFHFQQNVDKHPRILSEIADKYRLNRSFELYEYKNGPVLLDEQFEAEKHLDLLRKTKLFSLEKKLMPDDKLSTSPDFLIEAVKTFSLLYPLYCLAAFSDPLDRILEFEEQFGIPEEV